MKTKFLLGLILLLLVSSLSTFVLNVTMDDEVEDIDIEAKVDALGLDAHLDIEIEE